MTNPPSGSPAPRPELPRRPPRLDPVKTAEGRQRSGMLRNFGALFWASGLGILASRVRLEEHSAEHVRRAAERGPVVYVMHSRSVLDWLAVNRALNLRRLPLPRYNNGVRSTIFKPLMMGLREAWSALGERIRHGRAPDPVASGWLAKAVAEGMPSLLFMVGARSVLGRRDVDNDTVEALLDAQDRCERPIQLVPVVVIWHRKAQTERTEAARFVLGSSDEPGPLQKMWAVVMGVARPVVQAGKALEIPNLVARLEGQPRRRQARTARTVLRRYLYRENHVIRGPRIRPYRWTRRLVMSSPEVRRVIAQESSRTGRSEVKVASDVDKMLGRIAAQMSYPFVRFADHFCRFLFTRIYDGVDLRPEDAERIREAYRKGTPILVPCHRSHLDYVLISWVFWQYDLGIPHVCAGDNLSFWPLGAVLRRVGGFFIKRSFKGDGVFPVVFERYLRQLIRDGFPIEFYLEGGRSRTGKLLPAKHGVLGMVLDAAAGSRADQEVTFLPMAICYEQIAEENAYARELAGEEKEREDVGQVMRASKVIRKRFGRVYLRVGEPLPCSEVFDEVGGTWSGITPEVRHQALARTGRRLMYRIAESLVVLPTGLVGAALLAQGRAAIRRTDLDARCGRFLEALQRKGAWQSTEHLLAEPVVNRALQRFSGERLVAKVEGETPELWRVADDGRITLEYYKNGLLHFLAPASLLALVIAGGKAADADARKGLDQLVRLLRLELAFDADENQGDVYVTAVADLVAYGAVVQEDGVFVVQDAALLSEMAELTRNFVESYHLVLRACAELAGPDVGRRELPRKIQTWARPQVSAPWLRRPEALSIMNLKNALDVWQADGILDPATAQVRDKAAAAKAQETLYQLLQ